MNRIIQLEYSEKVRLFHVEYEIGKSAPRGWVIISESMDEIDAERFMTSIQKKYCDGRKTGQYPRLEVVITELRLFFQLKNVRRKLV